MSKPRSHKAKMEPASRPITISRTEGEWERIQQIIDSMGKKDLSAFIQSEAQKLISAYRGCPKCLTPAHGGKSIRQPWLSVHIIQDLEQIATVMKKPLASVIQEFIIAPLLRQEKA